MNNHNINRESLHVEAKTLELALVKAGTALGVPQNQVGYRVIKKERGLISLFSRRKVELQVWNKEEGEPLIDQQQLIEELVNYCRQLCTMITGEQLTVTARLEDRRLIINIDNDFLSNSMGRYPKIIESLEHLIRKKPRHLHRSLPFRIFVDIKEQRIKRENELITLARDLAAKVVSSKRPIVMSCKGSHERRVIHLALDGNYRVYTKSIGSGYERKLMILPTKDKD